MTARHGWTTLLFLATVTAGALLWSGLLTGGPAPALAASQGELDGQEIFMAGKCNLCHSVSSVGIESKTKSEKMMGPDLAGVGERHDAEFLAAYLKQEEELDGETHKKAFSGSDEEFAALIAWLMEQEAP